MSRTIRPKTLHFALFSPGHDPRRGGGLARRLLSQSWTRPAQWNGIAKNCSKRLVDALKESRYIGSSWRLRSSTPENTTCGSTKATGVLRRTRKPKPDPNPTGLDRITHENHRKSNPDSVNRSASKRKATNPELSGFVASPRNNSTEESYLVRPTARLDFALRSRAASNASTFLAPR